jgi:hypothetical protein
LERFFADLAVEAQAGGRVADPLARWLALAGVVVLGAFGDLAQVVALLSFAELADLEHLALVVQGGGALHRLTSGSDVA